MPSVVKRRRTDRKSGTKTGWWSEKQRCDAVVQYLAHGNLMQVSRDMGIPEHTLRRWKAETWWVEREDEVRRMATTELSGRLGKLIDKAVDQVSDRLENGDFVFDRKSGNLKRIGVKARDANQISKDMIDRKVLLDKIATKSTTSEASIEQRLKNLQAEFLKFANSKTIEAEVEKTNQEDIIDVEPQPPAE